MYTKIDPALITKNVIPIIANTFVVFEIWYRPWTILSFLYSMLPNINAAIMPPIAGFIIVPIRISIPANADIVTQNNFQIA